MVLRNFFLLIVFLSSMRGQAQSTRPTRPAKPYKLIRYQDDFTFLRKDSLNTDFFDPIKFIPLSAQGKSHLSMGGEIRHQYQWFRHPGWKGTPDDNGYFLQRYMFHTDLHVGRYFRFFAQLNNGFISGRKPGPRPVIDQNTLEANQFFLELKLLVREKSQSSTKLDIGFRVGRMEHKFGTARLIAPREGQNIRRSFEGAQLFFYSEIWKLDAFALQEVISKPGAFDDVRDREEWLFGLVARQYRRKGISLEPYILANHDRSAIVFGDTARLYRLSPGFRIFQKKPNKIHWNLELTGQWGRFGAEDFFAGLLAIDLGYQFSQGTSRPFVGLGFSLATGDSDASPGGLTTFESYFPKPIFGQATALNSSNLIFLHLEGSFYPAKKIKITLSHDQLFRTSLSDVFYRPSAASVVPIPENKNEARYIGHHTKLEFKYKWAPHYFLLLEYAIFPSRRFLQNMDRNTTLHYFSAKSVFRF